MCAWTPVIETPGSARDLSKISRARRDVDSELVLLQARRDVGMRARVDVGVDAQGDPRPPSRGARGRVGDALDLPLRLRVESQEARLDAGADLLVRLPDAGEDDPLGRESAFEAGAQLAARDDIRARAERGEAREDREAGVGLGGVADQVGESGKRGVEAPEGLRDFRPAVDVERRAVLAREIRERHAVAAQLAFTPLESRRACPGSLAGTIHDSQAGSPSREGSADEPKASARRTDHRRAAASELLCPGRAERRSRSRR